MADASDLERITSLLGALIRVKDRSVRDLERSLGISFGTLGRILSGRIELKFRHVFALLSELDVSPKAFFRMAYEIDDPQGKGFEALLAQLRRLTPVEITAPVDRDQLEALIRETLEKLGVTGAPPAPPPPKGEASPPARGKHPAKRRRKLS
jgi:transcriptional regulator with XRE-family HTH domain